MTDLLAKIREAAAGIPGVDAGAIAMGPIVLEAGAIDKLGPYLKETSYRNVLIAADRTTYEIAGEKVKHLIEAAGIQAAVVLILPNEQGDVIADEQSLIQLTLELRSSSAEAVIAVGSGTIHDIARFSGYAVGIPFISVPTAPSVDGFNSKGAPLIIRGDKKTIAAIGPDAIFADLDILTKAPTAMVAAGFGDMLGKYTSLFDWKFGSLTGGEPYSQGIADMTRSALQQCVDNAEAIAARKPEGIRLLTAALLESGFAMLLFGQSHPASGAEHHLSHYWEMEFLRIGRRQLLHGAKVGVACAEIAGFYHRLAAEGAKSGAVPQEHRQAIQAEAAYIPEEATLRLLLKTVGGPSTIEELGVDSDLLERSLKEAHHIRPNRYTLLKAYNER